MDGLSGATTLRHHHADSGRAGGGSRGGGAAFLNLYSAVFSEWTRHAIMEIGNMIQISQVHIDHMDMI